MSRIINLQEVRQKHGPRLINKKHIARLKLLHCCVCGRRDQNEIHHIMSDDKRGMGKRAGDDSAVNLCADHHRQAHGEGARSFERKHGLRQEADYQWSVSQEREDDD